MNPPNNNPDAVGARDMVIEAMREEYNRVLRESEERKAELLRIKGEVEALREKTVKAEGEWRAAYDAVLLQRNDAQEEAQRTRNRLTVLARNLPQFVAFWLGAYEEFEDAALRKEVREQRKVARELLTLMEPFAT